MHEKGTPWLPEEAEELDRQNRLQGKPYRELAAEQEVSIARIGQVISMVGQEPRPDKLQLAVELHKQGCIDLEIAEELHVSVSHAAKLRNRGGIKFKTGPKPKKSE